LKKRDIGKQGVRLLVSLCPFFSSQRFNRVTRQSSDEALNGGGFNMVILILAVGLLPLSTLAQTPAAKEPTF
jgi:hypothetical protein